MSDESDLHQEVDPQVVALEARARREGWKPLDEFSGDEAKWVDAETFLKRGEEINPILRKNNQRLQAEIDRLRDELSETGKTVKQLQEYNSKIEQKAYERAVANLRAERKAAIQEGDMGRAAELEDQLDELKDQKPTPPAAAPAPQQNGQPQLSPEDQATLKQWMDDNPWYNPENEEVFDYTNAVAMRLGKQGIKGVAFLEKVREKVQKQFPELFPGERRRNPSLVEPGAPGNTGRGGAPTSISKLPPEAQAAYKDIASEQWYKDLAKSQNLTPEQMFLRDYGA